MSEKSLRDLLSDEAFSLFRHELRQPLFAIALAAQNGARLLASGDPLAWQEAATKFDLILEQIERAQALLAVDQ